MAIRKWLPPRRKTNWSAVIAAIEQVASQVRQCRVETDALHKQLTRAKRKCVSVKLNSGQWVNFYGTTAEADAAACRQRQEEQRERIRAAREADALDRRRR